MNTLSDDSALTLRSGEPSPITSLPIQSGAVLILHDGVLYGVRYLPDGTPCPWDGSASLTTGADAEEPQPLHMLEWSTLDPAIRQRLLDGIRKGTGIKHGTRMVS